MPDLSLKKAVNAAVSSAPPTWHSVYARSGARVRWLWAAWSLGGIAATAMTVLFLQPVPPPDFGRQVTAFVELVYRD